MMNNFYKNIKDTLKVVAKDSNDDDNFIVKGELLNEEAQLIREKNRILYNFSRLDGQSFDFVKYNDFRCVIDKLSDSIDNYEGDYDVMKKVIVHMDLELGVEVFFTGTFLSMVKDGVDNICDYNKMKKFTFEELYKCYDNKYTIHK